MAIRVYKADVNAEIQHIRNAIRKYRQYCSNPIIKPRDIEAHKRSMERECEEHLSHIGQLAYRAQQCNVEEYGNQMDHIESEAHQSLLVQTVRLLEQFSASISNDMLNAMAEPLSFDTDAEEVLLHAAVAGGRDEAQTAVLLHLLFCTEGKEEKLNRLNARLWGLPGFIRSLWLDHGEAFDSASVTEQVEAELSRWDECFQSYAEEDALGTG